MAVGGAKGGVGKSIVCSNLAVQLATENVKVAIVDLDLGAANLHTMFGYSAPYRSTEDFFSERKKPAASFLRPTRLKNLYLLPANGFIPEQASLDYAEKIRLIEEMKKLPVDILLFDLGAGSSPDTVDFFSVADVKILVTTPEPTALMNTFEFLKNVVYRTLARQYRHDPELSEALREFKYSPEMKVSSLAEKIKTVDPWEADHLEGLLRRLGVFMIFNQIRKIHQVRAAVRLKNICRKQLSIELLHPGYLFFSEEIAASVEKMMPVSLIDPRSVSSTLFRRIALLLLKGISEEDPEARENLMLSGAGRLLREDYRRNAASERRWSLQKSEKTR